MKCGRESNCNRRRRPKGGGDARMKERVVRVLEGSLSDFNLLRHRNRVHGDVAVHRHVSSSMLVGHVADEIQLPSLDQAAPVPG